MGLKVGKSRAALGPLLLGFQVHHAIRYSEFGTESPFVFLAKMIWESLLSDVADGVLSVVW